MDNKRDGKRTGATGGTGGGTGTSGGRGFNSGGTSGSRGGGTGSGGRGSGVRGYATGVKLPPPRIRRTRRDNARVLMLLIAALAAIIYAFFYIRAETNRPPAGAANVGYGAVEGNRAAVCFIDVGQGDSILITGGDGGAVLIDAGEEAYADAVLRQLDARGVTKIDALIGTHPHSDHIGGLASVIDSYEIGALYMPRVTNNTKQFEKTITAAAEKGLRITAPSPGDELVVSDGLKLMFLGPRPGGEGSINDNSIIIKAVFSEGPSFLITGDAERDAERFLLDSGADLRADVLKVGHHGSATSTGADFLSAVNPVYAIIQCGGDNPYGHPDASVLELLAERGVSVLRTDISGTVTFALAESPGGNAAGSAAGRNAESAAEPSPGANAPREYSIYVERGEQNE
ncbi:MAG: MBL fold metallo-hydrolase [Oscillospiraceae bacterium]|nr:MBL fold metallo-hydrolase [Oscillospiraceae bacterium]